MKEWTGHVTEEWLSDWAGGQLSESEQQQMLRHLESCDHCAEQLAEFLEKDLASPPAYLQEEILERSRSLKVQTAKTVYQTSKRMQLLLYSLKVGFAVATSLFLLSISYEIETMELPQSPRTSITEKIEEESRKVNDRFLEFKGWLLHIEYKEEEND